MTKAQFRFKSAYTLGPLHWQRGWGGYCLPLPLHSSQKIGVYNCKNSTEAFTEFWYSLYLDVCKLCRSLDKSTNSDPLHSTWTQNKNNRMHRRICQVMTGEIQVLKRERNKTKTLAQKKPNERTTKREWKEASEKNRFGGETQPLAEQNTMHPMENCQLCVNHPTPSLSPRSWVITSCHKNYTLRIWKNWSRIHYEKWSDQKKTSLKADADSTWSDVKRKLVKSITTPNHK